LFIIEKRKASFQLALSLLNCDQKIVAKVLSITLRKHTASLIHHDPPGFILGRFYFSNVQHLLNVMYSVGNQQSTAAITSLDAEKAFDQIEWRYLYSVLDKFGKKFRTYIEVYSGSFYLFTIGYFLRSEKHI